MSFTATIYKILKKTTNNLEISKVAVSVVESVIVDVLDRLLKQSRLLLRLQLRVTTTWAKLSFSVKFEFAGQLSQFARQEIKKAVTSFQEATRDKKRKCPGFRISDTASIATAAAIAYLVSEVLEGARTKCQETKMHRITARHIMLSGYPSDWTSTGTWGSMGVPDVVNLPEPRTSAVTWYDAAYDELWIFGGYSRLGYMNDLWRFRYNDSTWTWMKGTLGGNGNVVYGTKGVANAANTPGARSSAGWFDSSTRTLWLFGGSGCADLWRYDIPVNMWTWVGGPQTVYASHDYGTFGVTSRTSWPGGRTSHCIAWDNTTREVWLIGGYGNANTSYGNLGDTWHYRMNDSTWTWVGGSSTTNEVSDPGTQGVYAPTNALGARGEGSCFYDRTYDELYMFGGGNSASLWKTAAPRPVALPPPPPVAPPVAPPVRRPVAPPVAAPVAPPMAPPVKPPVAPPVAAPVRPPVAPPVAPPATIPVAAPNSAPVSATAPVSPPVGTPDAPPTTPPSGAPEANAPFDSSAPNAGNSAPAEILLPPTTSTPYEPPSSSPIAQSPALLGSPSSVLQTSSADAVSFSFALAGFLVLLAWWGV